MNCNQCIYKDFDMLVCCSRRLSIETNKLCKEIFKNIPIIKKYIYEDMVCEDFECVENQNI